MGNAPVHSDLYIPSMAFVTYILLLAYVKGSRNQFTPDLILATATSAMIFLVCEVLLLKLAFYLLASGSYVSPPFLDLISYSGYKYVGYAGETRPFVLSAIA
jgi:hypothetical protein